MYGLLSRVERARREEARIVCDCARTRRAVRASIVMSMKWYKS